MRVLLALLALGGCVTILTGNWIWLARRPHSWGNSLLARLTAGIGAGSPVAVAALLLASRLLSWGWPARGDAEELVFAGCVIWALLRRDSLVVWWQQLLVAALLLACVPVAAAKSSVAGLLGAGPKIAVVAGVELGFLIVAAMLLTAALCVRRLAKRSLVTRGERAVLAEATQLPATPMRSRL